MKDGAPASGRDAGALKVAGLRITDQETARVVAVCCCRSGEYIGAGCLVSSDTVLSCHHVIEEALGWTTPKVGDHVDAVLVGVAGRPKVRLRVTKLGSDDIQNDLALLEIEGAPSLAVAPVQFCTPLRHGGKSFSVLGFPNNDPQGRNARGVLHAGNANDMVQMDCDSPLLVQGGFSGAPVWSAELNGFVGIVVTELSEARVAWCIPSRILCAFHPDLYVRFVMPPSDRPTINDYILDDPNKQIFGTVSNNGQRKLKATVKPGDGKTYFVVRASYQVEQGAPPARGRFVTFITHPSFSSADEDAYQLFSQVDEDGTTEVEFYPVGSFTIAAVGDGGDTALTLDLSEVKGKPKGFV